MYRVKTIAEEAHDALITGWAELAVWIKDRQAELLRHRRVETWALEWDEGGRKRRLLDEADTAEAQAWIGSPGANAPGVSQRLLDLIAASEVILERERSNTEAWKTIYSLVTIVFSVVVLWRFLSSLFH